MLYGPYVQVVRIGLKRFFVSWDTPPPVRGLDPTVPFPTQFLFSVGLIGHLFWKFSDYMLVYVKNSTFKHNDVTDKNFFQWFAPFGDPFPGYLPPHTVAPKVEMLEP